MLKRWVANKHPGVHGQGAATLGKAQRRAADIGVCLPQELTTVEGGSVFWGMMMSTKSLQARAMTCHSPGVERTLGDQGRGQQAWDQHVSWSSLHHIIYVQAWRYERRAGYGPAMENVLGRLCWPEACPLPRSKWEGDSERTSTEDFPSSCFFMESLSKCNSAQRQHLRRLNAIPRHILGLLLCRNWWGMLDLSRVQARSAQDSESRQWCSYWGEKI